MGILVSKVLGVTAAAYGDIFCARKPQILFYYDVIWKGKIHISTDAELRSSEDLTRHQSTQFTIWSSKGGKKV